MQSATRLKSATHDDRTDTGRAHGRRARARRKDVHQRRARRRRSTARHSKSPTPRPARSSPRAPLGGKADVDRAVAAPRTKAFEGPATVSGLRRSAAGRCRSSPTWSRRNNEELAQIESRNVGKPIAARAARSFAVSLVLEYYAGAANKHFGETIPTQHARPRLHAARADRRGRPDRALELPAEHGRLEARAGARRPATRASSSRPSWTPLTAIRLGELALEAGFPPGVVNVVTGPGRPAGAAHRGAPGRRQGRLHRRDDDRPGDHAAGRQQREEGLAWSWAARAPTSSSPTPTSRSSRPRVALCPCSTTPARTAPRAAGSSSSARCTSGRRALRAQATRSVVVGDPADDKTQMGSLVHAAPARARPGVRRGRPGGGRRAGRTAATRPTTPALDGGAFLMPTIFDGANADMRIVREEIFGPVVGDHPVRRRGGGGPPGQRHALRPRRHRSGRATSAGHARRQGRPGRRRSRSTATRSIHTEAPFGGYKMSGIGRELGMHALDQYTELKNVFVDLAA